MGKADESLLQEKLSYCRQPQDPGFAVTSLLSLHRLKGVGKSVPGFVTCYKAMITKSSS